MTPATMKTEKQCNSKCGWCAYCQNMKVGDKVERMGDDNKIYIYEIEDIDNDGTCISIINEGAYPSWVYIMADDCKKVKILSK